MNVVLSPELLASVVGVILSLAFHYVPKLNTWFAGLATEVKSAIMAVLLLLTTVVIYGGGCLGWFTSNVTCDQAGLWKAISILLSALIANQTTYTISPDTKSVKLAKAAR